MKKILVFMLIAFAGLSANAQQAPSEGKILAVWAGYIGGAIVGAKAAAGAFATTTVIGTTSAGAAVTAIAAPVLPVLAGAVAGAIAGTILAIVIYDGIEYVIDNRGRIQGTLEDYQRKAGKSLKQL